MKGGSASGKARLADAFMKTNEFIYKPDLNDTDQSTWETLIADMKTKLNENKVEPKRLAKEARYVEVQLNIIAREHNEDARKGKTNDIKKNGQKSYKALTEGDKSIIKQNEDFLKFLQQEAEAPEPKPEPEAELAATTTVQPHFSDADIEAINKNNDIIISVNKLIPNFYNINAEHIPLLVSDENREQYDKGMKAVKSNNEIKKKYFIASQ